jgi:hypothetical protein
VNTSAYLLVGAYAAAFFGALLGVVWGDHRKRRTRRPLPEDLKLLRMPGEYLWRRVLGRDESHIERALIGIFIPILVGLGVISIAGDFFPSCLVAGIVGLVVLSAFSLLLCVRPDQQRLNRRTDDYLGVFGEGYVAEILDPLKSREVQY